MRRRRWKVKRIASLLTCGPGAAFRTAEPALTRVEGVDGVSSQQQAEMMR